MSDLPKIYAHCPAGCKYETVHREEFNASASLIPLPIDDLDDLAGTKLQSGYTYKIYAPLIGEGNLSLNFSACLQYVYTYDGQQYTHYINGVEQGTNGSGTLRVINSDKYAESFTFKYLGTEATETAFIMVYEINGVRYEQGNTNSHGTEGSFEENHIRLTGDISKLFIYNADATIVATGEKGADGADGKDGNSIVYLNQDLATDIGGEILGVYGFTPEDTDIFVGTQVISKNGFLGTITAVLDSLYGKQYSIKTVACLKYQPSYKEVTIAADSWETGAVDPFFYKATVNIGVTDEKTLVEIIGTNTEYAKYGIIIGEQDTTNGTITYYAIDKPTEDLTLKLGVTEYD